jgi:MOSC domain-containing protein YiiM
MTGDGASGIPQCGHVVWIGVAPTRGAPVVAVERTIARADHGLDGDHHAKGDRGGGRRQVTLIQREHLAAIASMAQVAEVRPEWLRRNVLVEAINLLALVDRRFRIGEVVLEGTGPCEPCLNMERAIGPGGLAAMIGHGGITARVIEGGEIAIGAEVVTLDREAG